MPPEILEYDHARDWEAVKRIHFEVGWLDDEDDAKAFERLAARLDGVVFPLDGEAECAVFTAPGGMRYLAADLEMTAVLAVTTSRVARKLGGCEKADGSCACHSGRGGKRDRIARHVRSGLLRSVGVSAPVAMRVGSGSIRQR